MEHAQTFTTDRARQALSPRAIHNFGPESKGSFFSITQFLTELRESKRQTPPSVVTKVILITKLNIQFERASKNNYRTKILSCLNEVF
jgi:hypothetical protein